MAPWNELNLAYFSGYALWNYLTAPFLLTLPGIKTQELAPVRENGETQRRVLVRYPQEIMTHSRERTYYISERGLIVPIGPDGTLNRDMVLVAIDIDALEYF